jgi:hypothetical protein
MSQNQPHRNQRRKEKFDYHKFALEHGKVCGDFECGKNGPQPVENFSKSSDRHDGFNIYCKKCMSKKRRQHLEKKRQRAWDAAARNEQEKMQESLLEDEPSDLDEDARLRAQMDLNEKMYTVPQALYGCSLGPFVTD